MHEECFRKIRRKFNNASYPNYHFEKCYEHCMINLRHTISGRSNFKANKILYVVVIYILKLPIANG